MLRLCLYSLSIYMHMLGRLPQNDMHFFSILLYSLSMNTSFARGLDIFMIHSAMQFLSALSK